MINLINNELLKIKKSKIIFIEILFIVSLVLMNKYGKDSLFNLSFNLIPFIGVIISLLYAGTISSEIENGTMRFYLTKPYKRYKIYLSKVIACLYVVIISIMVIVITTSIIESKFDYKYIFKFIKYSTPIYFLSSFLVYLSGKFKSTVFVSCTSILTLCFSYMIAQILFGIKVTFIEYTFLPYLDFSIFNDQVYLEEMNSELGVNLSLNRGLIIDFIFTLIFLVIGIYKFSKKDIKN